MPTPTEENRVSRPELQPGSSILPRLTLNITLAFTWCLLHDEISLHQFLIGYLVGIGAMLFFSRSFGREWRYIRRVLMGFRLLGFFIKELVVANIDVVKQVLAPRLNVRSGILAYPLEVRHDILITLLANMITLTPGTLSVEVSPDRRFLFIHFLDIEDIEAEKQKIKDGFERYLLLIAE